MELQQKQLIHAGMGKYLCAIVAGFLVQFLTGIAEAFVTDEKALIVCTVALGTAAYLFGIYELVGLNQASKSKIGFFKIVFFIELIDAIFDFVIAIVEVFHGSLDNTWVEVVSCLISIVSFAFFMCSYVKVAKSIGYSCKLINVAMAFYIVGFIGNIYTVFVLANNTVANTVAVLGDLAISVVGWILQIAVAVQCYKKTQPEAIK